METRLSNIENMLKQLLAVSKPASNKPSNPNPNSKRDIRSNGYNSAPRGGQEDEQSEQQPEGGEEQEQEDEEPPAEEDVPEEPEEPEENNEEYDD